MDDKEIPKQESKPQATFLTKLYALLERPENHHMIRWDPAGEHIIVERPEQLALHVLPSIYRQSRFASFSRQLNIYGFMRKVNLRNVDPAIDDPDASTWSHPTLNRHSPPEVVANFKRRVPPRLPKPRKRDSQEQQHIPPPRSALPMGMSPVSLSIPHHHKMNGSMPGRARGFSAPGSYNPPLPPQQGWGVNAYPRALPPLTVPSEPSHHLSHHSGYDSPPSTNYSASGNSYQTSSYHYNNNGYTQPQPSHSHHDSYASANHSTSSSLSSLLNPHSPNPAATPSTRPHPTINTSTSPTANYSSPFSHMPMQHSSSRHSPPDSRPNTGYSASSIDYDYPSRPSSSHSPPSPGGGSRPASSQSYSLSIRRQRRHSQAMSPYPSPYAESGNTFAHGLNVGLDERPSTSPQPYATGGDSGNIQRVRSMIQLPAVNVDPYGGGGQGEFAYNLPSISTHSMPQHHQQRPGTGTSSVSVGSSSQANTPPVDLDMDAMGVERGGVNVGRFSPDFGFVHMNMGVSVGGGMQIGIQGMGGIEGGMGMYSKGEM